MTYNKFKQIISMLFLALTISLQTISGQPLSIEWGMEQPYHKRGENKTIEFIKCMYPTIFYKVGTTTFSGDKELIVKHNWVTGKNIYFDIKLKHKLTEFVESDIKIVDGDLIINSTIYSYKNDPQEYKQIIDTANLQLKNNWKKIAPNDSDDIPQFILDNRDKTIRKFTKDKNGNYYCGIRKFDNKNDEKEFKNGIVSLAYYSKDSQIPTYLPLKLPNNYYISYYQLTINDNEEIVLSGLYTKQNLKSAIGCFSYIISPELTGIKSFNIKEFPLSLLSKGLDKTDADLIADKIATNNEFDYNYSYKCSDIHFNKDGGFNIAIEKSRTEIVTTSKFTNINYFFNDIYVLSFEKNGEVKWMQKLPKYTKATNDDILASHYYLKYDDNDNMYFIFNQSQTKKSLYWTNSSKTLCIKYDTNGNEKYSEINTNNEDSKYICPIFFEEIGSDSILIVKHNYEVAFQGSGSSKNTMKFGILKLK